MRRQRWQQLSWLFNEADKVLWYGLGDTGSGEAQTVIAIGGEGAFLPSAGGGDYVKTVSATADTGISADTVDGDVTLAGIDATTTVKGVVRLATQAELEKLARLELFLARI